MHKIYLSIPNVFTVRRAFIYFLRLVDNIQSIVSATAPCVKEKELDFTRKGATGNKSHAQINLLYLPIFCYLFASFFSLDSIVQTSYLSHTSQIIPVEKNLSCGEISDFCKEFEQFMEFYRNLSRFCFKFVRRKICVEKISVEKK